MPLFHKILMAHDFSEHAGRALDIAIDLAKRYDAKLSLLHVYEPVVFAVPEGFILYPPLELLGLLEKLERDLAQETHNARAAGVREVEDDVIQGRPVGEIVQYVEDGGHDLIVMGTHGRTGIAHALIGSVAERVLRSAPCAVLSVR